MVEQQSQVSLSPPIDIRPEFRKLSGMLIEFLEELEPGDWNRETISSRWRVKDIVAHLLDTSLRRVSLMRDGYREFYLERDIPEDFASQFDYLEHLNKEWVSASARLSPRVLMELTRTYDEAFCDIMDAADMDDPAVFNVVWAGEHRSRNWMDFGREYTEKWYHQQQIRLAFENRVLEAPEFMHPVYRIFMRAVPHHLKGMRHPEVQTVSLRISGPAGGQWDFRRAADCWERATRLEQPDAVFHFDASWAWLFFTNRKFKAEMRDRVDFFGPEGAEDAVLGMLTMMA